MRICTDIVEVELRQYQYEREENTWKECISCENSNIKLKKEIWMRLVVKKQYKLTKFQGYSQVNWINFGR